MTQENRYEENENWTVGEILSAMAGSDYPKYILKIVSQLQQWMEEAIAADTSENGGDPLTALFENVLEMDGERLFAQLEWVDDYADLIPNLKRPAGHEDVVVVNAGPSDFEDSLRIAIDYASLFNRKLCRRIWVISDSIIIGDIYRYLSHIRALGQQGIVFRFLLVTPWGWTEIPLAAEGAPGNRISWKNNHVGGNSSGEDERKRDDRLTR
ncbi:hypothetical protein MASR1M66_24000 [Aminivibrio sp.]